MSGPITFVKLGGSLITDKTRPETARHDVIDRLAAELGGAPGPLVVGHGSGSFGHVAARGFVASEGVVTDEQRRAVSRTQAAARRLHAIVFAALEAAGARPFTWAPSSGIVASDGEPDSCRIEPLLLALDGGWLPVTFGDVVTDRRRGAVVCSTETIFLALAHEAADAGRVVERVLWMGETDGVLDGEGRTVRCLDREVLSTLEEAVGGSAGIDVTGGMEHRVEAALRLVDAGVPSWIGDGRRRGALASALAGRAPGGTTVRRTCAEGAAAGDPPRVSSDLA